MTTPTAGRRRRGGAPLFALAAILGVSGLVRLGDAAGAAIALELAEEEGIADAAPGDPEDVAAALEALRARTAELDRREIAVAERVRALETAEAALAGQLAALEEAEERLRALMTLADEEAEQDLAQLTLVYENMKPKEASLVFERMSPAFAAGFLGRMRPDAAAAIMSGLPPDLAYSISVLLAGRNADAAAFASDQ
jgi:flagellar motility protein MotE (MotC chaperone)